MTRKSCNEKGSLALLGVGRMGAALAAGILGGGFRGPAQCSASDTDCERLRRFCAHHGVRAAADNAEAARGAQVAVLAVKPKDLEALLAALSPVVTERGPLVLSVVAGRSTAWIEARLPEGARVVRAMPNLPAAVREGITALCPGRRARPGDLELAEELLRTVGAVVRVAEQQMDAVTALSGSGPAYVFYLLEIMQTAGAQMGLDPSVAQALALQTVRGAAGLGASSSESADVWRARVTSPGGTTEAAFAVLERRHVAEIWREALFAARRRAAQLSEE